MSEILFRGKRIDTGEWIYGYYARQSNHACFINELKYQHFIFKDVFMDFNLGGLQEFEVDPSTVGQYTGLTDKNGKKIFEGDIVHAVYSHDYVGIPDTDFGNLIVWFDDTYYGGARYQMDIIGGVGNRVFSVGLRNGIDVIGNIHDNPELIGGAVNG